MGRDLDTRRRFGKWSPKEAAPRKNICTLLLLSNSGGLIWLLIMASPTDSHLVHPQNLTYPFLTQRFNPLAKYFKVLLCLMVRTALIGTREAMHSPHRTKTIIIIRRLKGRGEVNETTRDPIGSPPTEKLITSKYSNFFPNN